MPSTEEMGVPRAALWAIAQCDMASGVVDTPITWEEIRRDARWMTDRLAEYGLERGDVVVVVSGPAEVMWSHPVQTAVSCLGGVFAMAWATRFDARRVEALVRMLRPKMVVGINAALVDGLAELPGGVAGELGSVPYVLARAEAHGRLEEAGVTPMLFDLAGPATLVEGPERDGARFNASEWAIDEREGVLVVSTVGDRALQLEGEPSSQRGRVVGDGRADGGPRVTIQPVTR